MDSAHFKQRTQAFALEVIKLTELLPNKPTCWVLGKQLLRSATSVGANYRSACRARSKPDFLSKITIAEEEADETIYWLELLRDSGNLDKGQFEGILREANEITAILTASGRTTKAGLQRR